jgi:hypothetical protein
VDQTLSALKATAWTASLPFKGHFCPETDDFNASLETEYDLFQCTTSPMYKASKHIIRFSPSLYPITGGFGKDSGGHSSPTNVTDLVQSEQRILKCSNFPKYSFEQDSSTMNQGTGTDSYCGSTYTGDKKNACGCKSSGLALKRCKREG